MTVVDVRDAGFKGGVSKQLPAVWKIRSVVLAEGDFFFFFLHVPDTQERSQLHYYFIYKEVQHLLSPKKRDSTNSASYLCDMSGSLLSHFNQQNLLQLSRLIWVIFRAKIFNLSVAMAELLHH